VMAEDGSACSLSDLLQSRAKLRPTQTKVTTASGAQFLEDHSSGSVSLLSKAGSPGFVVDLKPDPEIGTVLPGLHIGSQDALVDLIKLKEKGITHVLNVATPEIKQHFPEELIYKEVEILDLPETGILPYFASCFEFIDSALEDNKSVIVHCNQGVSRSATVIIGYLIKKGHSYDVAYKMVKEARSKIRPNDGFIEQLKRYEISLREEK